MEKNIQPLHDYVMLKDTKPEEVTRGGIVIPDSARKKSTEGIVVAKAADAAEEVSIGDRVIYREYSGTEITSEGEKYRMVPSGDLLAKYVESDQIPD